MSYADDMTKPSDDEPSLRPLLRCACGDAAAVELIAAGGRPIAVLCSRCGPSALEAARGLAEPTRSPRLALGRMTGAERGR